MALCNGPQGFHLQDCSNQLFRHRDEGHSGAFLLIDKARRIRGKYDGTKEEDVNRLMGDINTLRKEYGE